MLSTVRARHNQLWLTWMASVSTVVVIPRNLAISAKSANYKSWKEKLLQEDTIKRCKRDLFKNNHPLKRDT